MEQIDSYLKTLESKVKLEVFNLLHEVRTSKNDIAYKNIQDLYAIPEYEDEAIIIKYDPCLRIECLKTGKTFTLPNGAKMIFTSEYKLPENEKVIHVKIVEKPRGSHENVHSYTCKVITNYGRIMYTRESSYTYADCRFGSPESSNYYIPSNNNVEIVSFSGLYGLSNSLPIRIVAFDPLPYKMPVWCIESFHAIHSENQTQLQSICKDVYNIIGRWREHINENIQVDNEKMCMLIQDQTKTISSMNEQIERLQQIKEMLQTSLELVDKRVEIFESKEKLHSKNETYIEKVNAFITKYLQEVHKTNKSYNIDDLMIFVGNNKYIDKNEYHTYQTYKEEFFEYIEYQKLKRKFN